MNDIHAIISDKIVSNTQLADLRKNLVAFIAYPNAFIPFRVTEEKKLSCLLGMLYAQKIWQGKKRWEITNCSFRDYYASIFHKPGARHESDTTLLRPIAIQQKKALSLLYSEYWIAWIDHQLKGRGRMPLG